MKNLPNLKALLVRKALEALEEKPDGVGVSSAEIAEKAIEELSKMPEFEIEQIIKCGLNTYSGRLTSLKSKNQSQAEMFPEYYEPDFISLRKPQSDGTLKSLIFDANRETPASILQHVPRENAKKREKRPSKVEYYTDWAKKQSKGLQNTPYLTATKKG